MVLKLKRNISRSGRGLVLRIPADIVRATNLTEDSEVWIWIEDNKIIVEKAKDTD